MKKKIIKWLAAICGIIVIAIMNGVVLWALWNWFIVAIFECKSILLLQAIGLSFIVNYFSFSAREIRSKETEDFNWREAFLAAFIKSSLALGFASLLHYLL